MNSTSDAPASSATAATQLVEATTTGPAAAGVVSTDDAGDAVVGDESDASSSLPHAASRTPAATSNAVTRRLESVE
jgi:hypothetical protein